MVRPAHPVARAGADLREQSNRAIAPEEGHGDGLARGDQWLWTIMKSGQRFPIGIHFYWSIGYLDLNPDDASRE
ncbi:MAG: hypothetical protein ICV76_00550 [Nitrospiraceae bacterium]|nr:hypothetical protein [Nitrospiraceae bacterium]